MNARIDGWSDRIGLWLAIGIVIGLFGFPLFTGLGEKDFYGDEPIYAFAVDRMLENGDWLTPRSIPRDDIAFLEKPPLKFWIVAATMKAGLLPTDEFGHRFWDAAFGAMAFLYVFAIGRMAGGSVCGLVAVFILFVHKPLLFEHGLRSSNMESALLLSYCGGMFHALAWARGHEGARRWLHPLACGAWFVLGFMTKFVAALFLPAILVTTALLFPAWRQRARADWRPWSAAVLLIVALTAPWFVYQTLEEGSAFWRIILGEHVVMRFTSHLDPSHLQPWHFYITELYETLTRSQFLGSEAQILVILGVMFLVAQTIRRRWDAGTLLLLWFVLPVLAISAGSSKLYHYLYPFLPPLAIAAGLVPAALLHRDALLRRSLRKGLERVSATRPAQWLRRHPAARRLLLAVAVVALASSAATAVLGPFRLEAGDVLLYRNSSTLRPMLIGLLLLTVAGHARLIAGPLLIPLLVLALPFPTYHEVSAELSRRQQPFRTMRDCVLRLQAAGAPHGVHGHTETLLTWPYHYYLRTPGFEVAEDAGDPVLTAMLFDPSEQRPVVIHASELAKYRERAASVHSVRLDRVAAFTMPDGQVVLFPGRYEPCAISVLSATHQ